MIKNINNLENLKILDEEAKRMSCWAPGTISGSRVARIMNEPRVVLAEWLGDTQPIDPASNPIVKEKMEVGNYMEDVIINLARNTKGYDIQIDKNTYKVKGKPWYFNIDGINSDGSIVYEVKNTETASVEVLVERYKWQATWYKFLTGCEKVIFLFFIKGYKLRTYEYTPSQDDIFDMLNKCETIINAYNAGPTGYDMLTWGETPEEKTKPVAINDEQAIQRLNDLIAMQEDVAVLEERIKEIKEYFGEAIGERGGYIDETTGNKVMVVSSTRKGGVDVEKTIQNNPGVVIEYKPDYTTRTIRVTKGKK